MLKKNVLKHTRRAEISSSSKLELLTEFLPILKSNSPKFLIKFDLLKPALKMSIKDLLSRVKKDLIVITNVKKLLKTMNKLEPLEHQIEMLFPKL